MKRNGSHLRQYLPWLGLLLGVDALDECVEMVQNGMMTGTVLNDHVGQSHTAADVAIKAAMGEMLDAYYWVDYQMVK